MTRPKSPSVLKFLALSDRKLPNLQSIKQFVLPPTLEAIHMIHHTHVLMFSPSTWIFLEDSSTAQL
jgi:hypothetical protein